METPSPSQSSTNFQSIQIFILSILLIISAFTIGVLWTRVQYLEKNPTPSPSVQAQAPQQPTQPQNVTVDNGHLPVMGNPNAKVTIVEFSDFQCLFCRRFWKDTLPQIKKDYIDTGKVKLAYRQLPLPPDLHPMAYTSAEAAECANEQGKFWDYHDKMFSEQAKQGDGTIPYQKTDLVTWASQIGMNMAQFNQCLDSEKYKSNIDGDSQIAAQLGFSSTPSFAVNGQVIVGAQPYSVFKALIDKSLQ